jgi:VanZ family protein
MAFSKSRRGCRGNPARIKNGSTFAVSPGPYLLKRRDLMPISEQTARRSVWRWVYPVALAAMVVIASGRGQVAAPSVVNIDKAVHFSVFGLLATLVLRAPGVGRWWAAAAVVSGFGICDEIRQGFTPGRSVEFADWAADTAGALVAAVVYTFWPRYRRLLETRLRWPRRGRSAVPAATPVAVSAPSP